jgi:pimeloyl-CoA dehydrogenase small subunit
MDFDLSEEQRLLKDSVDRLIADHYAFEQRKKYMAETAGWSQSVWNQYAELGLLGLPFDEQLGGFGGGGVETLIVMEAFGRGLVLEPYFATVVLGGGLLRRAGSDALRKALVPQITAGKLKLAFAHVERQSRYNLADVVTSARKDGDGFVLDGAKSVVLHGDCAEKLLLTARISGNRQDRNGIGLFVVDADAAGLTRRGYPTQDGLRAGELTLKGVRVGRDAVLSENALQAVEHVVDEAIAALCAEAVGCMQVMHETTLEYLKTRQQFGRPIGSFQVLQHRSVDMLVALEQARSMAMYAAVMADEADPVERRRALAAAKAQIGRSGKHIGQEAIQLHGGIGMTMEYKVGHYFKRMTMIDMMFGNADEHLRTLAELGGLFGESKAA